MAQSTLRQVLAAFENGETRSMANIAHDLDVSPARLEGMIQYWVRKGKIRETSSYTECGSCGHSDSGCPFVLEMPRLYELVSANGHSIPLENINITCGHHQHAPTN